jgi:ATP-dependent RNA helicase DDX10/DBP4
MIVFDECDRLLDMGFEKTVDAILGHLPRISSGAEHGLQCLMFSATNNKKLVSERIRQIDFVDVDPHKDSKTATPNSLRHLAMNVALDKKLTVLWSFIKQHMFSKSCDKKKKNFFLFFKHCKLSDGVCCFL